MAYTTSKVDWMSTDYFNYTDWERIRANLVEVIDECIAAHWLSPQFVNTVIELSSRLAMPYYDRVNQLEDTEQRLYDSLQVPFTEWIDSVVWYARQDANYTRNPNSADWIRWEQILKRIKESLDYTTRSDAQIISGTSTSGNNRRVQLFSRGRV